MTISIFRRTLFACTLSLSLGLGAMACDPEGDDHAQDPAVSELGAQALRTGAGPGQSYICSGLECTCTGDEDCNDMFGSGVCGDVASCDTSGPQPVCKCLRLRRVVRNPITAVGGTSDRATLAR